MSNEGALIYVDGRLLPVATARVSVLDRGFTLGDSLFETLRARGATALFLDEHLARLREGAAVLHLPLPPEATLREAIAATLRANGLSEAVVRLTLTRGEDTGRGLDLPSHQHPTTVVRVTPFIGPPAAYRTGVHAVVSSVCRNESSPLAQIKSGNYGDNLLAREEARRRGADDAVLLNGAGQMACASAANIVIVRDGVLYTPPPASGVLPGITVRAVLDLATALGLPVRVESFDLDALRRADEAFLTNTVVGVAPLTHLDGHTLDFGAPGPLTQALQQEYARLVERLLGE